MNNNKKKKLNKTMRSVGLSEADNFTRFFRSLSLNSLFAIASSGICMLPQSPHSTNNQQHTLDFDFDRTTAAPI